MPGASSFAGGLRKSVAGAAPAEAVIDPQGDHVHVLADPVERTCHDGIDDRERVVRVTHEQVIVFDAGRPIRREAVFKSGAYGAAPAGRTDRCDADASKRREDIKAIARYGCAALQIQQRRVPGVTDLTGEKA